MYFFLTIFHFRIYLIASNVFHYITPTNPEERGAQISIRFKNKSNVKKMSEQLEKRGVVVSLIFQLFLFIKIQSVFFG